jgi:hypothetical protein
MQQTDRLLTPVMFESRVVLPTDTVPGYMEWYLHISHLYIIPIPEGYSITPVQTHLVV